MRRLHPGVVLALGAMAYPCGVLIGHLICRRSVIYPHKGA